MIDAAATGDFAEQRAIAFQRALIRAAYPVDFTAPPFAFDPTGGIAWPVARLNEPALGSEEYWQRLEAGAERLKFFSVEAVVSRYIAQEMRAVQAAERWITDWRQEAKKQSGFSQFENERRRSLLKQVQLLRGAYGWSSGNDAKAIIRLLVSNRLDVDIEAFDLAIDLYGDANNVIASGRIRHRPPYRIGRGVEGTLLVDVTRDRSLGNPVFSSARNPIKVGARIENVIVDGQELVPALDPGDIQRRADAVASLHLQVRDARQNLEIFRRLFPGGSVS